MNVPLPDDGKWVALSYDVDRNSSNMAIERATFADIREGKLYRLIAASSNIDVNGFGWVSEQDCSRKDIHLASARANYVKEQDCFWVNHLRIGRSSATAKYISDAYDALAARKIAIPKAAVTVGYRFADANRFATVEYIHNPEADGFAPPLQAEWASSDWHKDHYHADERKVAYVEALKAWAKSWYPTVKAGFVQGG